MSQMVFRACLFRWNAADQTMRLEPRFARIAEAQFKDGETYPLEVKEQRSSQEHRHYFAVINNAFDNISDEETLSVLSTPNKLRQWALICSGWCDVTVFGPMPYRTALNCAQRAAENFRRYDDYVEITVHRNRDDDGNLDGTANVVIKIAKSQSRVAMDKENFRASKRDVLDILAGQIHVKRKDLEKSALD